MMLFHCLAHCSNTSSAPLLEQALRSNTTESVLTLEQVLCAAASRSATGSEVSTDRSPISAMEIARARDSVISRRETEAQLH